jgi:hypothetical protein
MCSKYEYFETIKLVEGGIVHLGDGKACEVQGMGSVCLTRFDNCELLLHDVRYVPNFDAKMVVLLLMHLLLVVILMMWLSWVFKVVASCSTSTWTSVDMDARCVMIAYGHWLTLMQGMQLSR